MGHEKSANKKTGGFQKVDMTEEWRILAGQNIAQFTQSDATDLSRKSLDTQK